MRQTRIKIEVLNDLQYWQTIATTTEYLLDDNAPEDLLLKAMDWCADRQEALCHPKHDGLDDTGN